MEKQDLCGLLFKRWVRFLKDKKTYGRYLLCIQAANKRKDALCKLYSSRGNNIWNDWTYIGDEINKKIYLSKNDYFKDRFEINNLTGLSNHIACLNLYLSYSDSSFLTETYLSFRHIDEKKNPALPVPRGFRKTKRKVHGRQREDNSPWYNSFYQDKRILWRR